MAHICVHFAWHHGVVRKRRKADGKFGDDFQFAGGSPDITEQLPEANSNQRSLKDLIEIL